MGDRDALGRLDDAALVAAVAGGSQDALATLYDRHADLVHASAYRITGDRHVAEDVVQEVFLALWNRANAFDPKVGSLRTWLTAIARNRAVDRLRAAGRRPRLVAPNPMLDEPEADALERLAREQGVAAGDLADPDSDPAAALERSEARRAIDNVLGALPDDEREVILLAYRDQLSQSEIATRLGWPLGTVKTRTRRALGRLREALADLYGPSYAPVPIPVDPRATGPIVRFPATPGSEREAGR
jgi:RNA polymerase sigma-70 factor (ECF subfamily)